MNTINKLVANIKFNTLYTCAACGRQSVGDTVRAEVTVSSTAQLKELIDGFPQSPHYMPEGWSHGPTGVYSCGCHKGASHESQ